MSNTLSLDEAIKEAKKIKNTGGIKPIYIGLSHSLEDPLNRTRKNTEGLLRKFSIDNK